MALNLDTINNYGLIEIYETVLRRGKLLSIDAGINYGPANDALLLAAGYLNDLYMMLGNEAWADAANPTIGIGTKDNTYGDIATALFAFKGQVPSLLEEELALLRGRDDFLLPGVELRPVYNRLVWNYTRGIDAGEVIYALNYNIQLDQNTGWRQSTPTTPRTLYPAGPRRRLRPLPDRAQGLLLAAPEQQLRLGAAHRGRRLCWASRCRWITRTSASSPPPPARRGARGQADLRPDLAPGLPVRRAATAGSTSAPRKAQHHHAQRAHHALLGHGPLGLPHRPGRLSQLGRRQRHPARRRSRPVPRRASRRSTAPPCRS